MKLASIFGLTMLATTTLSAQAAETNQYAPIIRADFTTDRIGDQQPPMDVSILAVGTKRYNSALICERAIESIQGEVLKRIEKIDGSDIQGSITFKNDCANTKLADALNKDFGRAADTFKIDTPDPATARVYTKQRQKVRSFD